MDNKFIEGKPSSPVSVCFLLIKLIYVKLWDTFLVKIVNIFEAKGVFLSLIIKYKVSTLESRIIKLAATNCSTLVC